MRTDITVKEYDIHELAEHKLDLLFPRMGISTQIFVDSRYSWL